MKYLIAAVAVFGLLVGCKKGDSIPPSDNSGGMAAVEGSEKEHRHQDHTWNRDGGMHEHGKDRQVPGSN
jgi:hypothetical protein